MARCLPTRKGVHLQCLCRMCMFRRVVLPRFFVVPAVDDCSPCCAAARTQAGCAAARIKAGSFILFRAHRPHSQQRLQYGKDHTERGGLACRRQKQAHPAVPLDVHELACHDTVRHIAPRCLALRKLFAACSIHERTERIQSLKVVVDKLSQFRTAVTPLLDADGGLPAGSRFLTSFPVWSNAELGVPANWQQWQQL